MLKRVARRIRLTKKNIGNQHDLDWISKVPPLTSEEVEEAQSIFPLIKFFILGYARSGTTLLMRLVNLHPQVHCNRQAHFFTRPPFIYKLVSDPQVAEWLQRKSFRWNRGRDLSPVVLRAVADFILERDARREGAIIVGDKSPNNLINGKAVSLMHKIYPDARLIFIVRDGRDAVLSHRFQAFVDATQHLTRKDWRIRTEFINNPEFFHSTGKSLFTEKSIYQYAQGWVDNLEETEHLGKKMFGDQFHQLRFEDMQNHPFEELQKVWGVLGAEAGIKELEQAIIDTLLENRDAKWQAKKAGGVASTIPKGSKGNWRRFFSARDKAVFKEVAGKMLIKWNYEKDLSW